MTNAERNAAEKEQHDYIYVYGIIDEDISLNIKGLQDRAVEKIRFRDMLVLISSYLTFHYAVKEDEAMQHASMLNKIAENITVIPMSFGTIFKNQMVLNAVLEKLYPVIKSAFICIRDKIELGVKVLKNQNVDMDDGLASEILESLNRLSVKSVEGDKFSERLLLNHSFLVEKSKFLNFSEKIAELELKNNDLKFIYTGPWPPYSFVNIKIAGK